MNGLRRLIHALGIAAIGAVGVFLILESAGVIGRRWRQESADALGDVLFPTWGGLWAAALIGVGLALVGIAMVAAQLAPPKKGINTMHEVYKGDDGETRIRGRAAIAAVRHELVGIDGVVDADARITNKRVHVEVEVDDRSNLVAIENDARARLGHDFWINLGLADFGVNLLVVHHPSPPRVR